MRMMTLRQDARAMRRRAGRAGGIGMALGLAALGLSGCGLWSDDEPVNYPEPTEIATGAPKAPRPAYERAVRAVATVDSLELGQMYRARLLTAHGMLPAPGWYGAELRPRNEGRPGRDGFLEYDFVAAPPELNGFDPAAPSTLPQALKVRADLSIPERDLAAAQGVRVYAQDGAAALRVAVTAPVDSGPRPAVSPDAFTSAPSPARQPAQSQSTFSRPKLAE